MERLNKSLLKELDYNLTRIRIAAPNKEKSEMLLKVWQQKYIETVTDGEEVHGCGSIMNAYIMREALKQYIEELEKDND